MRVISFSMTEDNISARQAVTDLKSYAKKRGMSFSFLVIAAIKAYLKELENAGN